jgi:hypothetical protein
MFILLCFIAVKVNYMHNCNYIHKLQHMQMYWYKTSGIQGLNSEPMWCNHGNPTIQKSQTTVEQGWKSCTQLTTLNLSHFKYSWRNRIKIITSNSPSMALPPYQMSCKSTNWFKSWLGGGGSRHTDGMLFT